uniref:B30.2/SPRY domain-containing protein n=1 Tax=Globodera rostochiensis TaxID=31243 RepID=A0A914HUY5_GLORO
MNSSYLHTDTNKSMSATRSRRSGITDSGGLNPSTIHLLPMARVKKELEARGLDTKGNGAELAFRLQESVRLAGGYASKFDPSPTTETTPQKTRKRKHLEIEIDENVAEVGEQEAPLPVLVKPFHFTWASAPPTAPRPAKEAMILATEEQLTEKEEMDKQRLEEEEEKRKRSEEEAEEEKKRLKEVEEKRKKKEQAEEDKKKLKEDEEKRKNIEEENKKKLEEAEQHKIKRNEEVEKKKREEEERKRKKGEEGNKKKLEREIERKKKREGEVEKKKKSEEDEEKRKKNREEEMEQQRKKIENEVEKKKKRSEEDEEKRKKRREEEMEQNRKRVVDERKKKEPGKTREHEKEEQLKKESEEQKKVDGQRQQSTASKDPSKMKLSTVPTSTFSSNSVSLDILDSIMDSQQQLLTRKQRKDDEDETEGVQQFKVDFLRRQQRMSTGGKNGASASDIQKRRMSLIFGPPPPPPPPKQQKVPTESPKAPPPAAPPLERPEGSAVVPSTSASSFPLVINLRDPLGLSLVRPERPFPPPPPPPPPPPKRQKVPLLQVPELPKTAPPVAPLQEPEGTVASTSASAVPLVVNLRDPLGLSLVGSDRPFPPPPPPPPPKRQKVPLSFQASESAAPPVAPLQEPEGTVASTSASPVPLVINLRQPLGLSFVGPDRPFPPPPPPPPPKKNVEAVQIVQDVEEEMEETEQNEYGVGKETDQNEDGVGKETDQNENGVGKETDQNKDGVGKETDQNEDGGGKETDQNEDGGGMETDQNEDGEGKEADRNDKEEDTVQLVHDEGEETDQNEDEEGEETDQFEDEEADETDQNEDDEEEDTAQLIEDEEEEDAAQLVEEAEETDQNEDDEEETDQKSAEYRHLLKDPKSLLQKAQDVLRQKFGGNSDANISSSSAHYEQVGLNVEEFKKETDEEDIRQLPDPEQFHGEPVPEDMDDDLFELAAGLPPRNKNKEQEPKPVEEEPLPDAEHVEMDFYNSDLNMKASSANKWLVDPDNGDGFALMWGGVRANWGVLVPEEENQRVEMPPIAFQAKITEFLSLKHLPFDESDPHQIRVGWSLAGTSNMLGEQSNSFAFSSMGNKATNNLFTDFVDPFVVGEVITSVLDVGRAEIRYYKNGQPLGAAFTDIRYETGDVYFPHIATKNCKVMVNFGTEVPEPTEAAQDESGLCLWSMPSDEVPEETEWIGNLDRKLLASSRRPLADKSHCTIISMVGLPGVGKTTWVLQYLKEHPNEDWILLNTDTILQAMTIDGMPRHRVHQGRWDMVMGLTAKALNRSLQMACRRRHNYILDQTNVFREARKRKLTQFQDFQRKCVVIIPSEAEHERRLIRQAREAGGGGQMPAEAMLEMKGQFSIPCTESEPVDDVIFVEPPIERINEAIEQVMRYNQEGRPWVRNFGHQRTRGPESLISDHSGMPAPRFLGVTRIGI